MTIECLKGEDIRKTQSLYERIFQDPAVYTEYFYNKAVKTGTAFVCIDGDCIAAEVFLIPKLLSCDDRMIEAFYIYGVATLEEYRGKGLMRRLMAAAEAYAREQGAQLLYLIPVDEKIYQGLGFCTVKRGDERTYELTAKDAKTMLKFNLELLTEAKFNDEIYREINELENAVKRPGQLKPLRDKDYLLDRIQKAEADGGGVYLLRKRNDYAIAGMIMTGEEKRETVILEVVGEENKKEGFIKDFMRWKGIAEMREYVFPIMIKMLDTDFLTAWSEGVLINDEI